MATKSRAYRRVSKTMSEKVIPRIILVVMCFLYILPFYWMLSTAIKGTEELRLVPPSLIPGFVTVDGKMTWNGFKAYHFENYYLATQYIPFFRYMLNSLILASLAVIGAVISNSLVSYGLARINWKGRDVLFYIIVGTMFIPFPVIMIALFDIFAKFKLINTYVPLSLPYYLGSATWIFMMRQFLMSIPKEISDAGLIDGANEFQIFSHLILPIMKPAIGVIAIFAAIGSWNDFLGPLIYLQRENVYPLSIGLQMFRAEHRIEYSLLMAASTMVVLPIVIIFLSFQRFFVEGITMGSVKG
ncbi:sugar ABC transporter permease [Spirochaetia bacterium]|nr:sugar ABC transporter permease [Spirochaetia bacterium]